jgi:membrane associated rhomboid family serine protease
MSDPLGGLSPRSDPPRQAAPQEPQGPRRTFPAPPATSTTILLAVLGAVFLAQGAMTGFHGFASPSEFVDSFTDEATLLRLGSLFAPAVQAGDWWRLGSYAFLHIGFVHILMNGWALWVLMRPVEGAFGPATAVGLFAASALAGGVASFVASSTSGSIAQAAGASGGVFGLFGATGALWIRLRHRVPPEALRAAARAFLLNLLLNAAIAAVAPVDSWAHGGGLLAGMLLGLLAPLPIDQRKPHHLPIRAALLLAALVLAAAEGAAVSRAVHPVSRVVHSPGVEARVPWYVAPTSPGVARSPGGMGLSVLIGPGEGPELRPGKTVVIGARPFQLSQGEPQTEQLLPCREVTQVVSRGDEPLYVVVCCQQSSCLGAGGERLAREIAPTLRSTL